MTEAERLNKISGLNTLCEAIRSEHARMTDWLIYAENLQCNLETRVKLRECERALAVAYVNATDEWEKVKNETS